MKESLYINRSTALINYTKSYYRTIEELLSSEGFSEFLELFLNQYAYKNPENCFWVRRDLPLSESKADLLRLLKVMQALDLKEIQHPFLSDPERMSQLIEDGYHFWRNLQRYSIVYTDSQEGLQLANFMEADNQFNQMILTFYRSIQEKVQGQRNRIYRQLQAGTNAALVLQKYAWKAPESYQKLLDIPMISRIMLRTPLLIHPLSNKRTGIFWETRIHPLEEWKDDQEWMGYPCKCGQLLILAYFHRDFTSSAVALANLFELAEASECIGKKPDGLVFFGNPDGKEDTVFYHDQENSIWLGKISYGDRIEYFGYMKKIILTLHNLAVMEKGWLPLHGAMVNLTLQDGTRKGVVMIGDSGAGKSETIEALRRAAGKEIVKQEVVFDDMGSLHLENGELVAMGTETGAFVRLDDLEQGSAYRDLDRSIFFNPESANARVVVPASSYELITRHHRVDLFLYANNYTDRRGLRRFASLEEAKKTFIEGKRFALGTTQEKGLSSTFFANPFGPLQKREECAKIIDVMFDKLKENDVFLGEIYTCLGLADKGGNGINIAAEQLLEELYR